MRHNRDEKRFNRRSEHLKAMLNNMAASLLVHESIETTLPKAKELRRVVERLITLGKQNTVHARRRAFASLKDRTLVKRLFDEIAPRYKDRDGGYTRIVRIGSRRGDAAPMSIIKLVEEMQKETKKKKRKPKETKEAKVKTPKEEDKKPEESHAQEKAKEEAREVAAKEEADTQPAEEGDGSQVAEVDDAVAEEAEESQEEKEG